MVVAHRTNIVESRPSAQKLSASAIFYAASAKQRKDPMMRGHRVQVILGGPWTGPDKNLAGQTELCVSALSRNRSDYAQCPIIVVTRVRLWLLPAPSSHNRGYALRRRLLQVARGFARCCTSLAGCAIFRFCSTMVHYPQFRPIRLHKVKSRRNRELFLRLIFLARVDKRLTPFQV
jgi:hypothetical protein